MSYVIVGASAGLGRALAQRLAQNGHSLVIIAQDARDLDAMAADLSLRFGVRCAVLAGDLAEPEVMSKRLTAVLQDWVDLEGFLFASGWATDADDIELAPNQARRLLDVNLTSAIMLVEAVLPRLRAQRRGVIVGFGSIAASRGRSVNMVYAAAKRGLESYFESLRHALTSEGIRVQFYVIGFLDTNMSFDLQTPLPKASPERLADRVVGRLDREFGKSYFPAWWAPLCLALKVVPWSIMRRLQIRHK